MSRDYSGNNEIGLCLSTLHDLEREAQHLCERIGAAVGNVGKMRDAAHTIATSSTVMSTAAEELSQSIHHIAEQTDDAANATSRAAAQAKLASDLVTRLETTTERISNVVHVIGDVARKTRMLALNASIEAARAGEAGHGFSVVADEVKQLAQRTQQSASDAVELLSAITLDTHNARDAVDDLARQVTGLDAINSNISSAVQQQGSASSEIAMSLASTVESLADVSEGISGIINAAKYNEGAARNIVSGIGALKAVEQTS
jgi:methyl-accepting chemotaxis protein